MPPPFARKLDSLPSFIEQLGEGQTTETNDEIERRAFNGTAYRIFKLLQWLIEEPLTVEKLNARFVANPLIAKAVSNDSVWLYINTLKLLGCRIRRPSPKNGFCYQLLSHPFSLSLSDAQQETLILAKAHAQKSFTHYEMLKLDSLYQKITKHCNITASSNGLHTLLQQNSSYDLEASIEFIQLFEHNMRANKLFFLSYRSPLHGDSEFYFLPELLYYNQGILHVRGESSDQFSPRSLRIDWITSLRLMEHPALREELYHRRNRQTIVFLRLYISNSEIWNGLNLDIRHGIYEESILKKQPNASGFIDVKLKVRDFFHLKQKLLCSNYGFQILEAEEFRQDLHHTLQKMSKFYEVKTSDFH